MLAPDTLLQNRYRIVRLLAQGGMGAVYEARDERLGHVVAVKESFFAEEQLRKAFEREARLLAGLRHPALPKVSDHFSEGAGQFLVMEFIPGSDLGQLAARRGGAFEVRQVLDWAETLLGTLDYLHSQNPPIIHRDIKPSNLKLTERGELVLLDFGLAKGTPTQASRITSGSSLSAYTPGYAPVEQIQGSGTDARSDLFALAATLHHLMTGVPPVDALTRAMNLAGGDEDPLRPAHAVNPRVPVSVSNVLRQTLALKASKRPATASELRRLLREAAESSANEPSRTDDGSSRTPPTKSLGADKSEYSPDGTTRTRRRASTDPKKKADTLAPTLPAETRPAEPPPVNVREILPTVAVPPKHVPPPKSTAEPASGGQSGNTLLGCVVLVVVGLLLGLGWNYAPRLKNLFSKSADPNAPISVTASADGKTLTNDLGMTMIEIPTGSSPVGSAAGDPNEKPVHEVTISRPFFLGRHEVTREQWMAVMGTNPSGYREGKNLPVENVSWNDVQEFLRKLNARTTGYVYRLPSEHEWEYACRAGSRGKYCFGDDEGRLPDYAWFWHGQLGRVHEQPVGQKQPNAWGLYDMHGNVAEFCRDVFHETHLGAPTDGSARETGGDSDERVHRGGSYYSPEHDCRASDRSKASPDARLETVGFRIVVEISK